MGLLVGNQGNEAPVNALSEGDDSGWLLQGTVSCGIVETSLAPPSLILTGMWNLITTSSHLSFEERFQSSPHSHGYWFCIMRNTT
jgi:hypothetical protein